MGKLTEINKNKLKNALQSIKLTAAEQKTVEWFAGCEPETVDNLCNIIEKKTFASPTVGQARL